MAVAKVRRQESGPNRVTLDLNVLLDNELDDRLFYTLTYEAQSIVPAAQF
jgi:hypothetical protein